MKRLIPIIFLLTVSGCSETVWRVERKPETVYTEGVQSERLHADSLLDIFDWKICGDVVAVMTSDREGIVKLYSYPDFIYLGEDLRYGRGPEEYLSANWAADIRKGMISLYDMNKRVINEYRVGTDGLQKAGQAEMSGSQDGSPLPPYVRIVRLSDEKVICQIADPHTNHMVCVNMDTWEQESDLADMLRDKDSDLDQYLCYFQYIDSNGKYLVRAFESIEKIDIYRIDAGSEVCPEVAIEGDIQVPDMENMHYTGVSCGTISFAVLHYSAADAAYNIELYDYSGRQLANIRAGNSCVALLYDEQRRTVYTGDESEDGVYITRYNLPVCRKN